MTSSVATGAANSPLPQLDRLAAGADLSDRDALRLVELDDGALADLCAAASELRDRGKGRVITFSPKVFIR